jgi:subtilisin-like proprotein convertase family protein
MSYSSYIECRYDESHRNYVKFNVFCSDCQRPLFRVKWWHHAILLNLAILSIGFITGHYDNRWVPSLLIGLLFFIYLFILFRRARFPLLMSLLLFALTFPVAFLKTQGGQVSLKYVDENTLRWFLDIAKISWIHLTCIAVFISYTLAWGIECDIKSIKLLKGFPALSLGWLLILIFVYGLDARIHFLNESVTSVIKHQIFIREILLLLSISYLLILALTRAVNNKIEVPKNFFEPETEVDYWTEPVKAGNVVEEFLLKIARPVYNIALNVYKILTQILKSVANFIIFLLRLSYARVVDYLSELLSVIEATIKLFFGILKLFLRYVAIPLLITYGTSYLLLELTGALSSHINGRLLPGGYTSAVVSFVELNCLIFLLVWLIAGEGYEFIETLQSIFTTNTLFTLIIALYACVASFELWPIAQLLPASPFKTIGIFTKLISVLLVLGLIAVFIKLNPQKLWAGVAAGAVVLLLGVAWWIWSSPEIQGANAAEGPLYQAATPAATLIPRPTRPSTPTPVSTPYETSFSNTGSINIPDVGTASPYPSTISVSGINGAIGKLTVTVNNLSHSLKSDLDMMLVGPNGQSVILMSDVSPNLSTITFDDAGEPLVPTPRPKPPANGNSVGNTNVSATPTDSRTYQPTNKDSNDKFPNLPPVSGVGTSLSIFNGSSPNGTWKLYVVDDAGRDSGRIAGGWRLTIRVDPTVGTAPPP